MLKQVRCVPDPSFYLINRNRSSKAYAHLKGGDGEL